MDVPAEAIAGVRAGQARWEQAIADLTDADVAGPSSLPGWTVGHLLTHIARNADSVVRRLDGAARGEIVDQYPGGAEGRRTDIEAGAGRSAGELVADVRATDAAVIASVEAMPDDAWDRPTRNVSGEVQPARAVLFSRWREVEVHLVDLGRGYTTADWPDELMAAWLPGALSNLAERCDHRALIAWIAGRAGPPEVAPWE